MSRATDGSRMTLRPDTVFRITQYTRGGDEESALLRLFRGGFRAVTGLVAKRGPDAFRVQTATSTIVRGSATRTFVGKALSSVDIRKSTFKAQSAVDFSLSWE